MTIEKASAGENVTLDENCGTTDVCEPIAGLHTSGGAMDNPWLPYGFIWMLFKMIGLDAAFVDIIAQAILCRIRKQQKHGLFKQFTGFMTFMTVCCPQCVQGWALAFDPLMGYLKYKVLPNMLLTELYTLTSHPSCEQMLIAHSSFREVLTEHTVVDWNCSTVTLWTLDIWLSLVICFYTLSLWKHVEIHATDVREQDATIDMHLEPEGAWFGTGRCADVCNYCFMRSLWCVLFILFLFDVWIIFWVFAWYRMVVYRSGLSIGLNLTAAFSFDIKISAPVDFFQIMLFFLSVLEFFDFIILFFRECLLNLVKKAKAAVQQGTGNENADTIGNRSL